MLSMSGSPNKSAVQTAFVGKAYKIFLRQFRRRLIDSTAGVRLTPQSMRSASSNYVLQGSPMRNLINRFWSNEEGAALIEYGMLVGLIAVVCVVAVQLLGTQINTVFTNLTNVLTGFLPA